MRIEMVRTSALRILMLSIAASVPGVAIPAVALADEAKTQAGKSFEVPYLLTQTNHFVVRALINGQGPFHLVVDTGAPGLFLSKEASKKAGIVSSDKNYYSVMDEIRLEGGPRLEKLKMRVEDPFQLVGMNALGLPGMKLDGLMGFSVLARYRITLDPTHHRMIWTRLDFEPNGVGDDRPAIKREDIPVQLQAMEMLGPAMKFAAFFVGKQPPIRRLPQGFAGFTARAEGEGDAGKLIVDTVWPDSPAAVAGLKPGDVIAKCDGKNVRDAAGLGEILSKKAAGKKISLDLKRENVDKSVEIELQERF
jgi:hypothetical protein